MDRRPGKIDSPFRYVLVSASRAEQLMRGARPKADPAATTRKPTVVAMKEVTHEMVEWEYGPAPVPEVVEEVVEETEVH